MVIVKRDGRREELSYEKMRRRVQTLCRHPPVLTKVDVERVAKRVVQGACDGVRTQELDDLAAETSAALSTLHPEYANLAGRIAVSSLHKPRITSGEPHSPLSRP